MRTLEAESIHILREVAAELENPVLLYSIGKDSSVTLASGPEGVLSQQAAIPAVAHRFDLGVSRDDRVPRAVRATKELGLDVIAYVNEEGVKAGINPFDHGSKIYTDVMRTQPLKEA